ncbi:predicted protein [Phaeodactylum tricornutum CCAP 1055/1]|uniref:Uncharacterized protein n=1 Tax=Phaeodactylum tricornutum (strain CCAP 1055/1) TaxID=556484 RepID=B7G4Q8_PHATC|nr:predicted protein [Phaeodactylum tricornutum CCAP 1055/1]EEC46656.1 predicted protein [Phaeodactylum tricornutum CCAP 1055/1]|eukprot:XP_002182116.1 predicted protein [Phaeodactylum tricornutum CCAP 1055/1]
MDLRSLIYGSNPPPKPNTDVPLSDADAHEPHNHSAFSSSSARPPVGKVEEVDGNDVDEHDVPPGFASHSVSALDSTNLPSDVPSAGNGPLHDTHRTNAVPPSLPPTDDRNTGPTDELYQNPYLDESNAAARLNALYQAANVHDIPKQSRSTHHGFPKSSRPRPSSPPPLPAQQQTIDSRAPLQKLVQSATHYIPARLETVRGTAATLPPVATVDIQSEPQNQRRRRRSRPPPKPKPPKTPEYYAVKQRKYELTAEWAVVRNRWQKRKYDYRDEPDVGNVVSRTIERVWRIRPEPHINNPTNTRANQIDSATSVFAKRQADPVLEEEPKDDENTAMVKKERGSVDPYVDTSDEEQDAIYRRLVKSSLREQRNHAMAASEGGTKDLRPWSERLDFYSLGYAVPRDHEIPVNYWEYVKKHGFVRVPDQVLEQDNDTDDQEIVSGSSNTVTIGTFHSNRFSDALNKLPPVPRNFPYRQPTCSTNLPFHFHRCYALQMAAQLTVGMAGLFDDGALALSTRTLRLLCQKTLYENDQSSLVRLWTGIHGDMLQLFVRNTWKNRREVAELLGLTPDRNSTGPLDLIGFQTDLGKALPRAADRIRQELQKKYKISAVPWDATTSLPRVGSIRANNRTRSFAPQTPYVFLPGTIPPKPTLPMDVTGIEFGTADRNSTVSYWSKVDHKCVVLASALLVAQIATARLSTTTKTTYKKSCALLRKLLQETITSNTSNWYKRYAIAWKEPVEVPLVALNYAVMDFINMSLNGVATVSNQRGEGVSDKENESMSGEVSDEESILSNANPEEAEIGVDAIAERLVNYLGDRIEHNGLEFFSRPHLSFGLLQIAKVLPESAARILGSPLDHDVFRTPFDVFRSTLQHLEDNGLLFDQSVASRSIGINVAQLEHAIYQATVSFSRCVDREPTNTEYHAWYIGGLASALLLSSGNKIGSGARCYPSQLTSKEREQRALVLLTGHVAESSDTHGVRQMLSKFNQLRRETAKAFKLLCGLVQRQETSRSHLVMKSFLEWKQALALMIGAPAQSKDTFRVIRQMHQRHLMMWSRKEQSLEARNILYEMEVCKDARLEAAASALEQDPTDLKNWRWLIQEIGNLAHRVSQQKQGKCKFCLDCALVRKDLNIDHQHRERVVREGWMKHRHGIWEGLFNSLSSKRIRALTSDSVRICRILSQRPAARQVPVESPEETNQQNTTKRLTFSDPVDWLDEVITEVVDRKEQLSAQMRNRTYDNDLPGQEFISTGQFTTDCEKLVNVSDDMELLCYKIYLLCYMYGPSHAAVEPAIISLVNKCWNVKSPRLVLMSNKDECKCLDWLSSRGLNIAAIVEKRCLDQVYETRSGDPLVRGAVTRQMREAIKDSIAWKGYFSVAFTLTNYEAFKPHTRNRCMTVFTRMVQVGEVEDVRDGARSLKTAYKAGFVEHADGTRHSRDPLVESDRFHSYEAPESSAPRDWTWASVYGFWVPQGYGWDPVEQKLVEGRPLPIAKPKKMTKKTSIPNLKSGIKQGNKKCASKRSPTHRLSKPATKRRKREVESLDDGQGKTPIQPSLETTVVCDINPKPGTSLPANTLTDNVMTSADLKDL